MAENEEGKKEEAMPPSGERPFIPFPHQCAHRRPFDPASLINVLMANDGPMGVAQSLDHAYATLAEYLANDPTTSGQQYGHILYDLRRLRNALLQGGGWHQL